MEHEKWHWQEPGTAWRGVGVYHITLTVPSREPLLGTLVIPEDNPQAAWIERTALGDAVIKELYVMGKHYPAIRILQFSLMPDHLHAVIHVTKTMETSIRSVIRGYWQGVKKHGRAYTSSVKTELNTVTTNEIGTGDPSMTTNEIGKGSFPNFHRASFYSPAFASWATANDDSLHSNESPEVGHKTPQTRLFPCAERNRNRWEII